MYKLLIITQYGVLLSQYGAACTNVFDSLCRAPGDMAISATLPGKQKMFEVSDGLGFYVAI